MSSNRFTAREPDAMTFQRANNANSSWSLIFRRVIHLSAIAYTAVTAWMIFTRSWLDMLLGLILWVSVLLNFVIPTPRYPRHLFNFFWCIFFFCYSWWGWMDCPEYALLWVCSVVFCLIKCERIYPWMDITPGTSASRIVCYALMRGLRHLWRGKAMVFTVRVLTTVMITLALFPVYGYFLFWLTDARWLLMAFIAVFAIMVFRLTGRIDRSIVRNRRQPSHRLIFAEVTVSSILSAAYLLWRLFIFQQ